MPTQHVNRRKRLYRLYARSRGGPFISSSQARDRVWMYDVYAHSLAEAQTLASAEIMALSPDSIGVRKFELDWWNLGKSVERAEANGLRRVAAYLKGA